MTYVMHSISQMDVKAREEENRLSPLLLRVPGKREREGGGGWSEGGREGGRMAWPASRSKPRSKVPESGKSLQR